MGANNSSTEAEYTDNHNDDNTEEPEAEEMAQAVEDVNINTIAAVQIESSNYQPDLGVELTITDSTEGSELADVKVDEKNNESYPESSDKTNVDMSKNIGIGTNVNTTGDNTTASESGVDEKNNARRADDTYSQCSRPGAKWSLCNCISEKNKCCISLWVRFVLAAFLLATILCIPGEDEGFEIIFVRKHIFVAWLVSLIFIIPAFIRNIEVCRHGKPAWIGRPQPDLHSKPKKIQQLLRFLKKPGIHRWRKKVDSHLSKLESCKFDIMYWLYQFCLFVGPLSVGLVYAIPLECYSFLAASLLLSFVFYFEGAFLGMILVTHYLLHYIGNVYLALTFDLSYFVIIFKRTVVVELLMYVSGAATIDVLPLVVQRCIVKFNIDDSRNRDIAATKCFNQFVFSVGYQRRLVIGLIVIFRALHSMTLMNDFPGRSLNYPSSTQNNSTLSNKLYVAIIFLTAVVANAFEMVINGSILVQCSPTEAATIWATSFFRLFKNCFVDMGLMIKAFHRSKGGWAKNEKVAAVIFTVLFIGSFGIACFLLFYPKYHTVYRLDYSNRTVSMHI
uniref:Uncharacterized protein n=1 Tax=Aplanochytrium stocchinoi TaxID=215587 RepID=A0A7S3LQF8_9STRA